MTQAYVNAFIYYDSNKNGLIESGEQLYSTYASNGNNGQITTTLRASGITRLELQLLVQKSIKRACKLVNLVRVIAKICDRGGGDGGRPNLAQAGGRDASKLPEALAQPQSELKSMLA